MPPKGWRKNADGKFPQNPKDLELVSIDEILFPKTTISKLAKAITSDNESNMIVSKDSLLAIQRSATVFVSHLMFHARQIAKEGDRKNVTAQDILQGLEKADLSGFIPEVKERLLTYEQKVELKKKQKAAQKAAEPATKKMKDNDLQLVPKTEVDSDDDEIEKEETEEKDEHEIENDNENQNENEIEDENDNEDVRDANPIAILGQDETELEGDKEETIEKESSDGEDQ